MDNPNNLVWHPHSITGHDRARHNAQRPFVIAGFISPFARDRAMVRHLLEPGEFVEVHLNAPLAVCEQRDPKGLYKKARAGEIRHVTGIDSPYEAPEDAEVVVDTSARDVAACVDQILDYCRKTELIPKTDDSGAAGSSV